MSFDQDINRATNQLKALDRNISLSLPEAVEEGAKIMVAAAQQKAPVDTGKLKQGIKQKAGDRTANSATQVVFNNVFYAGFVERGTKKMKRQPFMRPAFDETQRQIAAIAERIVKAKDGI